MHETGCSDLVHWDDTGRWDGEGWDVKNRLLDSVGEGESGMI